MSARFGSLMHGIKLFHKVINDFLLAIFAEVMLFFYMRKKGMA